MSRKSDGVYDGTMADWFREVTVKDGRSYTDNGQKFDAFGRTEVSQITTQLDLKQSSGELTDFIDFITIGTGQKTYNPTESSTTISVSANGDKVIGQTFQRTNYQTGKAKVIKMTFNGFQGETDVIKRIGYFSADFGGNYETQLDGVWLESDVDDIYTNVYRLGISSSSTPSSSWNGEDVSDVDWTKNQLLRIEFAWLGVAAVKWSLFRDGAWVNFHNDIFDNTLTTPYMIYPNHPMRWEIQSDDGAGEFTFICASSEIEGAENQLGKLNSVDRGSDNQNANSTSNTYVNIGISLDPTKTNSFRSTVVDVVGATSVALTTDAYLWKLVRCLESDISGTALSWNSVTESGVRYFVGADDNLLTGGQIIQSGYVAQRLQDKIEVDGSIKLGVDLDGNPDIFVLAIQPLGANLDVLGTINFRELN